MAKFDSLGSDFSPTWSGFSFFCFFVFCFGFFPPLPITLKCFETSDLAHVWLISLKILNAVRLLLLLQSFRRHPSMGTFFIFGASFIIDKIQCRLSYSLEVITCFERHGTNTLALYTASVCRFLNGYVTVEHVLTHQTRIESEIGIHIAHSLVIHEHCGAGLPWQAEIEHVLPNENSKKQNYKKIKKLPGAKYRASYRYHHFVVLVSDEAQTLIFLEIFSSLLAFLLQSAESQYKGTASGGCRRFWRAIAKMEHFELLSN